MSGARASSSARIDLVGDIHGSSARLLRLLSRLGYERKSGRWSHGEGARLVFLGDYADKGDDVEGGIELVRELCDHRVACAIAGNHDTNALAFCMRRDASRFDARGAQISARTLARDEAAWIRKHERKNIRQHCRTLGLDAAAYEQSIAWFATLPLWLELPGLRAVHAAWIPQSIGKIRSLAARGGSDAIHSAQIDTQIDTRYIDTRYIDTRYIDTRYIDTRRTDIAWLEARSIDEAIELQHARVQAGGISARDWRLLLDLASALDEGTGAVGVLADPVRADESTPDRTHAVALERVLKGVECPLGKHEFRDSEGHPRAQVRIRWFDGASGRRVGDHVLVPPRQRKELPEVVRAQRFEDLARDFDPKGGRLPPLSRVIPLEPGDAYGLDERPVFFGHYGFTPDDDSILLRNNVACLDTSAYDDDHGALTAYCWQGEQTLDPRFVVSVR